MPEEVNNLCDMILMTAVELAELAPGIEYYFQNCERRDKEVDLYCALEIAEWAEDDELWMKVYDMELGNIYRQGILWSKGIMI